LLLTAVLLCAVQQSINIACPRDAQPPQQRAVGE